jgi:hypothetical protein
VTIVSSKTDEPAPEPPKEAVTAAAEAANRVGKSVTRAMRMVGPPDSAGQCGSA